MSGPLNGVRVIEMAGIGPGPYACMLLSDLGAEVIRIDRSGALGQPGDVSTRGRRSIALNLKSEGGLAIARQLIDSADMLVEGFRPGVMEKLGLGPEVCCQSNERLIYGRMTGWGQDGPLAMTAGHDINYIALSGMLASMGDADRPPPVPLNVAGDLGGGSLFLVMGMLAALHERSQSGKGQVIDAAICDGAASLMSTLHGLKAIDFWDAEREHNMLDGGAPFYRNYECKDGRYISFGAIEPQFYALLLEKLDIDFGGTDYSVQLNKADWPRQREQIAARVKEKTQAQWCAIFDGTDACVAPIVPLDEAIDHPHNAQRGNLVERDGVVQTGVAPRLSRTPGEIQSGPAVSGAQSRELLQELGFDTEKIESLIAGNAVSTD